jgi:hypothetical protein
MPNGLAVAPLLTRTYMRVLQANYLPIQLTAMTHLYIYVHLYTHIYSLSAIR